MKILNWQSLSETQQKECLSRPMFGDTVALHNTVLNIIDKVKNEGDKALFELSEKYDDTKLNSLRLENEVLVEATESIKPELKAALQQAYNNIKAFHRAAKPQNYAIETMPGLKCEFLWRPIRTVGIYIPGGTAPLFSTVMMLAIPAVLAGCHRVVLCTPARRGAVNPAILAAASMCGVEEIYPIGGAQAIAAMAYGTNTISKVDKIFGPGNAYVTLAKKLVALDPYGAAIDMQAGPSEVLVFADSAANPQWVAADLLAQAEHDPLSQVVLVTTDKKLAEQVVDALALQSKSLLRKEIIEKSLKNGRIFVVENIDTALSIINRYAPEHLILNARDANNLLPYIYNAGSVFVGAYSTESAGDYASGTNHVLPTYGNARSQGGVSIYSFMKSMTAQTLTNDALQALGETLICLANAEGLDAHASSVHIRLRDK